MPNKTLTRQGLGQETHIQRKIEVVKQQETQKLRKKERNKGEKSLNTPKGRSSLVESPILLQGKSLYG
jgi:hypothetical protein